MVGRPAVEARMQTYKMCSGGAAKESDSLRRTMPTRYMSLSAGSHCHRLPDGTCEASFVVTEAK